jgi:hypothetical protein
MKTYILKKKLVLNKETVSDLTGLRMRTVYGGGGTPTGAPTFCPACPNTHVNCTVAACVTMCTCDLSGDPACHCGSMALPTEL